ncbi:MAG TPA: TlpA disulfide reductase family protein [Solirubrobacteraceae bacterium]|jgi:cytochrome c biogenesis protein CcmG/thiol:disulfide interchange protein DsbE|nr:TlpA disulfide reductase family protein [Solirubrobacteraceae bacterium]
MPRPRTLLIGAAVLAALVAFVVFGLAGSNGNDGRPAPDLPLEHLSGEDVTLAALRGHPVLVSFWASWCEPCEREAPTLERFARSLHGQATLVGVNWEDLSLGNARKFIRTYGWTFPNLRDPDGNVGRDYGMSGGPPVTFVIDGAGRLRAQLRGPQTQQTLSAALESVGA